MATSGAMTVPAFIDHLLTVTGYRDALRVERTPEAEARLENLEELIAAAEDYTHADASPTLEGFLDGVALVADIDEFKDEGARVTMGIPGAGTGNRSKGTAR